MQFPDVCSQPLCEKPGISTIVFQCMKRVWGNCMRICPGLAPQAPRRPLRRRCLVRTNVARNSPETVSGFELYSLVFQRFLTMLKLLPIELRASFLGVGA